ncbi:MAG: hypothetical protein SynsKO_33660 [Synoicihabitans sp.]
MNHPMLQLLLRWSVMALGVTLATKLVGGIYCDDATTLVVVVLLLSFLNAVLKPVLVLFTLPFIMFTLGLGIVLINAFLFMLVARLVDGFYVSSFGAAFFGAIIVSVTNLILINALRGKKPAPKDSDRGGQGKGGGGDVIDV